MKNLFKVFALILAVTLIFTSCKKKIVPPPIVNQVEDGYYIAGTGVADTGLTTKSLMHVTRNEVTQKDRSSLLEEYIAVKANGSFNIVQVAGTDKTVYGPGSDFAKVPAAQLTADEPKDGLWRGSYAKTTASFTVPDAGLYHVVIDTQLGKVAVAKADWGIIGGATPGGWTDDTKLTAGAFSLTKMDFTASNIILVKDQFKFRYSGGWKIILDSTYALADGKKGVRVNTNFGGAVDALVPGGDNIVNTEPGYYTIAMDWTYGTGMTASLKKTAPYTPPAYPDSLFIVGGSTNYGWAFSADGAFHKVADASNAGVFWKICYIADTSNGFKISAANWGAPNLGFSDVDLFDADGVSVSDNSGNMSIATAGMYMVVVDLRNDSVKVSVTAPMVYGIGDAFGGWTTDVPTNLFTVNLANQTLVSPALPASGAIRTYVRHKWIPAWWNAEFVPQNGAIFYRNDGGDPPAISGTAGQVITYHFDDNTASVQ